eukprot:15199-Prymnesium_polylepis.5
MARSERLHRASSSVSDQPRRNWRTRFGEQFHTCGALVGHWSARLTSGFLHVDERSRTSTCGARAASSSRAADRRDRQ